MNVAAEDRRFGRTHGRRRERGSALLIVFLFAAIIAITLYTEMPIAVFEAKRQKEQLLIDRGNQYAQAVRLFVRATKQYPPNIEALENTNRVRYLRNRYKDPFTGKDDWRLLHAGPNGMLIDSKVQQAPNAGLVNGNGNSGNGSVGIGSFGNNAPGGNTTGGANASLGGNITTNANASFAGFNAPSANTTLNAAGANTTQNANGTQTGGFGANSGSTGRAGGQSSFGGFFSQTNTAARPTGADGQTAGNNRPENPFSATAQRASAAIANGGVAVTGTSPDGESSQENPENTTTEPVPFGPSGGSIPRNRRAMNTDLSGGGDPNAADNGAATLSGGINSTQTAAAGAFGPSVNRGVQGGVGPQQGGGSPFGNNSNSSSRFGNIQNANLAGVASKAGGLSIKLVNEQESYPLWEFFYDPTKDPMRGAMGVQGGGANGKNGLSGIGNSNTNTGFGSGQNSPQNAGFSGSNGFGNTGFGGGNRSFGNNSFGNSTVGTSSQAPTTNPSMQTMSTSSSGP